MFNSHVCMSSKDLCLISHVCGPSRARPSKTLINSFHAKKLTKRGLITFDMTNIFSGILDASVGLFC